MIASERAVCSPQITVEKNTEIFNPDLEQVVDKIRLKLLITLRKTKTIKNTVRCGAVSNKSES